MSLTKTIIKALRNSLKYYSNHDLKERVKLSNQIVSLLMAVSIPYIFIFYFIGETFISQGLMVTELFFSLSILLNVWGYHYMGRALALLVGNFAIFFFSTVLGGQSGIQNLYFAFIALPTVIFKVQYVRTVTAFSLLSFSSFMLLYYTEFKLFNQGFSHLNDLDSRIIFFTVIFATFLILLKSTRFLLSSYEKSQSALQQSNLELTDSLEEAKTRKIQLEKVSQQAAFTRLSMGIAHEIRNPMASMLTRTELLEECPEDLEAVLKFTRIIKKNIHRILNITNLMLKYGNPVSRKVSQVSIPVLIDEIFYLISEKCRKRGIIIQKNFESESYIESDPICIQQALSNIVINAIESMIDSGGAITINYRDLRNDKNAPKNQVEVIIKDTGLGMSPAEIDSIFDPFYTTKYENTGLGLSIVLKCIDEVKGTIQCQSKKEEGTTFVLRFPTTLD